MSVPSLISAKETLKGPLAIPWTPSRPKCKRILNRQKYHKKTFFKMISLLSQRIGTVCAMF